MNPSIDVRLDSMMRAIADFVLPELEKNSAAAEQAALVLGHLQVLRGQIDCALAFEEYELDASAELAEELLDAVSGGAQTQRAADVLRSNVDEVRRTDPQAIRESVETVRCAIEDLVRASGVDGSGDFLASSQEIVIRHERAVALANRSLFQGMGWESGASEIPVLEHLLARIR